MDPLKSLLTCFFSLHYKYFKSQVSVIRSHEPLTMIQVCYTNWFFYKSDLFVIHSIVQWTKNSKFLKSFSRFKQKTLYAYVYVRTCARTCVPKFQCQMTHLVPENRQFDLNDVAYDVFYCYYVFFPNPRKLIYAHIKITNFPLFSPPYP